MANLTQIPEATNTRPTCQGCGSQGLEKVLDLGYQPLCNEFIPVGEATRPQTYYPLCVCYCHKCLLVQLDYVIPTEVTFGDQYTYLTGSSPALIKYYDELALRLSKQMDLKAGDGIVEIGSNDGTFLQAFQRLGMEVLGIEGALQSTNLAKQAGVPVIEEFFGPGMAAKVEAKLPQWTKIKLVIAMNVMAHTDNINLFLDEVAELMGPDTILISQSHWLMALVRKFEFDTIYHEHLRYYTLESLMRLFQPHGLNVYDAELTDFYGGSVLSYANKSPAAKPEDRAEGLKSVLKEEEGVNMGEAFKDMSQKLLKNKAELLTLLTDLKLSGRRVVGLGAPMKASTLLNFYGINQDLISKIGEVNQLKVGTVVPGVRIPVVHEDALLKEEPDYVLLLTWNMADHIIPKLQSLGFKGKFIVPVPELEVIG
jgi:hypothetical protein